MRSLLRRIRALEAAPRPQAAHRPLRHWSTEELEEAEGIFAKAAQRAGRELRQATADLLSEAELARLTELARAATSRAAAGATCELEPSD